MKSVVGAFLTAVNFLYASVFGGPIDGTAWEIKVKQDGFFHWGSRRDTLVFHSGRLVVAGAVSQGYVPPIYEAKDAEAGTAFAAVLEDPSRDAVEWKGTVDGDRISGVVIVRARDGRVVHYNFTGERKG